VLLTYVYVIPAVLLRLYNIVSYLLARWQYCSSEFPVPIQQMAKKATAYITVYAVINTVQWRNTFVEI